MVDRNLEKEESKNGTSSVKNENIKKAINVVHSGNRNFNKEERDAVPTSESRKEVIKIAKMTRSYIAIIALLLVLLFGWLQVRDYIILQIINIQFTNIFYKVTLAIYFSLWVYGTTMDLDDEEYTLLVAPSKSKLTISAISTIIITGIAFGILCSVQTPQAITIVLSIFFIVNVISWQFLIHYVQKPFLKSKQKYEQAENYFVFLKLEIVEQYLYGNWQWKRFGAGLIVLLALNIIVFFNLSSSIVATLHIPSSLFVVVFLFFLYICVMEIWIWHKRLHKKISFKILDDLDLKYGLQLKENSISDELQD